MPTPSLADLVVVAAKAELDSASVHARTIVEKRMRTSPGVGLNGLPGDGGVASALAM
jgi:hypothetical protein